MTAAERSHAPPLVTTSRPLLPPQVKVYLNGVFVPKFFTKRTFIAKVRCRRDSRLPGGRGAAGPPPR